MGAAFAERLNYLFESIRPLGRGPFLNAEVVDAVRSMGVRMSAPYMSQLPFKKVTFLHTPSER